MNAVVIAALEEDLTNPDFFKLLNRARLMEEFWEASKRLDRIVMILENYDAHIQKLKDNLAKIQRIKLAAPPELVIFLEHGIDGLKEDIAYETRENLQVFRDNYVRKIKSVERKLEENGF